MKKIFTLLAFVITIIASAQAPQGFNYQATVRNSSGALITNQNVLFKFNIMLNSQTSLPVYSETHQAPTDDLGQVSLTVGQGTPTIGSFASINWANGTYYLGIELNTGSGYVTMGTTQLLSVPYALYANSAGSTTNNNGFTHYIGELYGGGIVVSVWKTDGVEHGLIASLTNLGGDMGVRWTTPDFAFTPVVGTSYMDGLSNTNAIIAQAGAGINYAAGLCRAYDAGGFNDWYLPALNELKQCYNSLQIVNDVLGQTNGFDTGGFYWSSTEYNESLAWFHNFYFGNSSEEGTKGFPMSVRAVRRF